MQSPKSAREYTCANVSRTKHCLKKGKWACKGCRLILYCSPLCQKAHWGEHKKSCKSPYTKSSWTPSWHTENRCPAFINNDPLPYTRFGGTKYLWGNMPAIDILALGDNEGKDYANDLSLLFAASGDLRNVFKTVANIPKQYEKQLQITLNDHDLDIVARNAIMLILLLATGDTTAAVDCVLHIWYSAQITKAHKSLLDTAVRPLLQEMCDKISGKPNGRLLAKTWSWGEKSIRIVLSKEAWNATLQFLSFPSGLSSQQAHNLRLAVTLAPERKDFLERHVYSLNPQHRVCFMRYREDGILLPFGCSRSAYNVPNPTFFQTADTWPLADGADPIDGWSPKDVMDTFVGDVTNDIYGKIYFHVKDTLISFCERMETSKISFDLFQVDAASLDDHLLPNTFARIEVSNICDHAYLRLAPTIGIFTPMLQKPTVNPHATLITLFMNAVQEGFMNSGDETDIKVMTREMALINEYLPYRPFPNTNDPYFIKVSFAKSLVRDVDRYLAMYLEDARASLIMQLAKVKIKSSNSVVGKWPARLKLRPGQPGAQEEFESILASKMIGTECYLEWQRAKEV